MLIVIRIFYDFLGSLKKTLSGIIGMSAKVLNTAQVFLL